MKGIIKLDTNESPYKFKPMFRSQLNRYPDSQATLLKKAYSSYSGIGEDLLMCGNGSDEMIDLAFAAFAKNRTVVGLDPDFSMYDVYAKKYQARFFKTSVQDLSALKSLAIHTCAAMVVLSNPNNPTGKAYCQEAIAGLLEGFDGVVLVDEAYVEFGGVSVVDWVRRFDRLLVTRTCSKALGMANLRIGFAVGGPRVLGEMAVIRSPYNVNGLSQMIGAAVLEDKEMIERRVERVMASRVVLAEGLSVLAERYGGFELADGAGNFVFLRGDEASKWGLALRARGIWVRSFDRALRVTVGTRGEVRRFLKAFECILKEGEAYGNV